MKRPKRGMTVPCDVHHPPTVYYDSNVGEAATERGAQGGDNTVGKRRDVCEWMGDPRTSSPSDV